MDVMVCIELHQRLLVAIQIHAVGYIPLDLWNLLTVCLRQNAYQYFLNQLMHIAHSDVITPDSSNHEFGLLLFATFLRFLPDFISDVGMDHIVIDRVIKIAAEHKILQS